MTTCVAKRSGLAGYTIDGCRCPTCTTAQNAYNARRRRLLAYNQWEPYVDAEPVRAHVRSLMAAGMGWMHLARVAGVANGAVSRLLYGDAQRPPSKRVRPGTAAALLAMRADLHTLADRAMIDATGTRRRAQGLAAIGWSLSEQARHIGWTVNNYHKMATRQNLVAVATARMVADMYRRLSATRAPDGMSAQRSIANAAKHGWAPPAAWDDEDIDDPGAAPNLGGNGFDVIDEVAIRRVIDGHARYGALRLPERRELIRRYHDRIPNLCNKIGMSGTQYNRWVAELCETAA